MPEAPLSNFDDDKVKDLLHYIIENEMDTCNEVIEKHAYDIAKFQRYWLTVVGRMAGRCCEKQNITKKPRIAFSNKNRVEVANRLEAYFRHYLLKPKG